jgi:hypothetical protein
MKWSDPNLTLCVRSDVDENSLCALEACFHQAALA